MWNVGWASLLLAPFSCFHDGVPSGHPSGVPLTFPYPPPLPVKKLVGKLLTHECLLGSKKVHTEIPRSKNGMILNTLR